MKPIKLSMWAQRAKIERALCPIESGIWLDKYNITALCFWQAIGLIEAMSSPQSNYDINQRIKG